MMRKQVTLFVYIGIVLAACAPIANSPSPMSLTDTEAIETSPPPMASITPLARSAIFSPTATLTPLPMPTVASLKAQVTADLLSCRYGPGADYLYLFALRKTANIQLVGRVDEDNWKWALVENRPTPCWVNTNYLNMAGDLLSLPVVYTDYPR